MLSKIRRCSEFKPGFHFKILGGDLMKTVVRKVATGIALLAAIRLLKKRALVR